MAILDYLNNLITQRDNLADNLVAKGVSASNTELFDTLVPKVLQIEGSSGSNGLNIYTQINEPDVKEGIWLQTNDTYVDIVTDSNVWTAGSWNSGTGLPYDFYHGSAVSIGTDIYLLGSSATDNRTNCYKYDSLTSTYTKMANIPYEFYRGSAVSIGTDIYLLGSVATDNYTNCYKYNTLTNTYTKMTDIPYDFYLGSAVSIGTDIYLLGSSATDNYTNCYKYNTLTNTYTKMTDIPYDFYSGSAVFVQDKIYTLGGTIYPTYNQIYSLIAKQFSNNSFVIERVSEYYGKYFTQFHKTPNNFSPVNFGRITSGFDNAWIYNNDDLQEYPAYYGNGTAWIKFKN